MRNKRKKRCIGCLLFYSVKRKDCPYCGYNADNDFSQPYHDALPLCSVVETLRIGRAVQIDRNSIIYIGLDTIRNKRILIREFFSQGYVRRQQDGKIIPADPSYTDIIEQDKLEFIKKAKQIISENGTVYIYRRMRKKRIRNEQNKLPVGDITLRSIIGTRANQEDSADLHVFRNGMCAVLCDGMGGIKGGETASTECVRIMLEIVDTVQHCDEGIISVVLQRQAIKADQYISSLQDMEKRRLQCGTTLLCAVIREDHLYFVSVGDSHIYLLRGNTIQLLTEEHNYLADLMQRVADGEMEYEDAVNHPKRDALTSYIGIGNLPKLHVISVPILLQEGDSILMCSDGLYRALRDEEILHIITENTSVEAASDALIRIVEECDLPKKDNTTLILYKHSGMKRK